MDRYEFAGELALTGGLHPIRGAFAMTVDIAQPQQILAQLIKISRAHVLPEESAAEAGLVSDVEILPAKSLLDVRAHLSGHTSIMRYQHMIEHQSYIYSDFNEVKGQSLPKRTLEIAATGGHGILMAGPLKRVSLCLRVVMLAYWQV
jgi:magnesium chelatase family protein